jgi:hypothetical protein
MGASDAASLALSARLVLANTGIDMQQPTVQHTMCAGAELTQQGMHFHAVADRLIGQQYCHSDCGAHCVVGCAWS